MSLFVVLGSHRNVATVSSKQQIAAAGQKSLVRGPKITYLGNLGSSTFFPFSPAAETRPACDIPSAGDSRTEMAKDRASKAEVCAHWLMPESCRLPEKHCDRPP